MKRFLLVALIATAANAQVVATAGRNIAVGHDHRVELFDDSGRRIWTAEGVEQPVSIATGADRIAVIDSFANELRVVDLANGRSESIHAPETPIAAIFLGRDLFVLARDASRLERIGGGSVALAPDPAFMRAANGRIYVYSRLDGIVQEIAPDTMRVTRKTTVAPFASDFEIDRQTGYLVDPHAAKVHTFSLTTMKSGGDLAVGAVPVDLAIGSRLAIADPSAKRVWVVERNQSFAAAFTRGFIRGLLGFGLYEPKNADVPTGVDRVSSRGSTTIAYDSTTRTLYRLSGSKPKLVAQDVAPGAFAVTDRGIAVWENGALRLIR